MAVAVILDFLNLKILTCGTARRAKLHHRTITAWQSVKPLLRYGKLSIFLRWWPSTILDLCCVYLDHPQRAYDGLCHSANLVEISLDSMQVWILCELGLRMPIHTPKIGALGDKIGEGMVRLTPNKLVLTFGGYYPCATFGENRSRNAPWECGQRDGRTHADRDNWFYNLSLAICYSYGAGNKLSVLELIFESSLTKEPFQIFVNLFAMFFCSPTLILICPKIKYVILIIYLGRPLLVHIFTLTQLKSVMLHLKI